MHTVSQSPSDPAFVENPYRFYREIRALGDVVLWEEYGMPMAATSEAVNMVLRHPKLGREIPEEQKEPPPKHLEPFFDIEANSLLEREPPTHTRLKKLVVGLFQRRAILNMAPEISRIADQLISEFPSGPFDLRDAFARLLPVHVITRLLGIPQEMGPQFLNWSNDMVAMYQARRDAGVERRAANAAAEFATYVRGLMDRPEALSRHSLITQLVAAEENGQKLTSDEIVSTVILLLNAGHEATVHAIGNAVCLLADFPERALALQPEQIEGTIEECLRFDPPLHLFTRYAYEDVDIMGVTLRRGDKIGCLLGSACRDDAVWPDGKVFDPFRAKRQHLAFGAGIHFCMGAPLARLEMQIALPALFSRCPKLRIVEPPKVADIYHFRGREKIMIEV